MPIRPRVYVKVVDDSSKGRQMALATVHGLPIHVRNDESQQSIYVWNEDKLPIHVNVPHDVRLGSVVYIAVTNAPLISKMPLNYNCRNTE